MSFGSHTQHNNSNDDDDNKNNGGQKRSWNSNNRRNERRQNDADDCDDDDAEDGSSDELSHILNLSLEMVDAQLSSTSSSLSPSTAISLNDPAVPSSLSHQIRRTPKHQQPPQSSSLLAPASTSVTLTSEAGPEVPLIMTQQGNNCLPENVYNNSYNADAHQSNIKFGQSSSTPAETSFDQTSTAAAYSRLQPSSSTTTAFPPTSFQHPLNNSMMPSCSFHQHNNSTPSVHLHRQQQHPIAQKLTSCMMAQQQQQHQQPPNYQFGIKQQYQTQQQQQRHLTESQQQIICPSEQQQQKQQPKSCSFSSAKTTGLLPSTAISAAHLHPPSNPSPQTMGNVFLPSATSSSASFPPSTTSSSSSASFPVNRRQSFPFSKDSIASPLTPTSTSNRSSPSSTVSTIITGSDGGYNPTSLDTLILTPNPASILFDDDEDEEVRLARKRKRNRIAADKCRKRKVQRINALETELNGLEQQRWRQNMRIHSLQSQIIQLRQRIQQHQQNGCVFNF